MFRAANILFKLALPPVLLVCVATTLVVSLELLPLSLSLKNTQNKHYGTGTIHPFTNMKVTIDIKRVLHLLLLILLTLTFGGLLIQRYDWKPLSAYGLACSIVCQINNVILKFHEISSLVKSASLDGVNGVDRASISKRKKAR